MKRLVRYRKVVVLAVLIIIVFAVPVSIYGYNNYNFNKLYNSGLNQVDKENFDSAINNFNASLKYKPKQKNLIESKINLAKDLKDSKAAFDSALVLEDGKRYLEAIDTFKTVKIADTKRYNDAQNKIKECYDSYIKENLVNAKSEAANKSYEKAIAYLDTILKLDSGNKEAQALKDEYNKDIEKIAADAKKAEEDRLAAQKIAKAKSNTSQTTTTTSTSTNSETDTVKSNNNLLITLNGSAPRMMSLGSAVMAVQPMGIYYTVFEGGFGHPIDYDITFYLVGRTVSRSGKTSGEFQLIAAELNEAPFGEKIKIVINFKLNGKVYTTTGYRVINSMRN